MNKPDIQAAEPRREVAKSRLNFSDNLRAALESNRKAFNSRLTQIRDRKQDIVDEYRQLEVDEHDTVVSLQAVHSALKDLEKPE